MPTKILFRDVIWRLGDEVISSQTDEIYPQPNGRYHCGFCDTKFQRTAFMEHYPRCKREFLGEE
jgi:hypothetical protein